MERIVNGHFADPNSTRDITGITPEELCGLISVLCSFSIAIERAYAMNYNEAISALQAIGHNPSIASIDNSRVKMVEHYNTCKLFLEAINQPYPGATYPTNDQP